MRATGPCARFGPTSSTPRRPGRAATPRWPTPRAPARLSGDVRGHPGIPTLTTPRLVLRPFVLGDLDELAVLHAEESFWWYPLRSGMTKEETAGFLERVIGALRERRLRDRGGARPGQRDHDRVGRTGRAPLPARDPAGRRGGVAPGRPLAWPRAGHRGRCRRGRVRVHHGRPRAHRQHLRAGERGVRAGHGAPGVHALRSRPRTARRGDRGD